MKTLISNPPYNMKWQHPMFAQIQDRFNKTVLPPESNSNFAFILTAINNSDKSSLILPLCVLTTTQSEELEIKKYLVNNNLLESVIVCPDKMFESTSIPVCILTFNKNKNTAKIDMVDMSRQFDIEIREQKGQFGSLSHTNRTYKREIKIFNEEQQNLILDILNNHKNIKNISKQVSIEEIKENDYNLSPSIYVEVKSEETKNRGYEEIIIDLNKIIEEKNKLKLTINEEASKSLGCYDLIQNILESKKNNGEIINSIKSIKVSDKEIIKEQYLTISKNKNEVIFSQNKSNNELSSILVFALKMWGQHIYYLNQQENIYLAELRDKLLPDLMNGKINLDKIKGGVDDE